MVKKKTENTLTDYLLQQKTMALKIAGILLMLAVPISAPGILYKCAGEVGFWIGVAITFIIANILYAYIRSTTNDRAAIDNDPPIWLGEAFCMLAAIVIAAITAAILFIPAK